LNLKQYLPEIDPILIKIHRKSNQILYYPL